MPLSQPPARVRARIVRLPLVLGIVVLALLASTVGTADAQPQRDVAQDRPIHDVERLRLECEPGTHGDQRGVLCRWSESSNPHLRGYQLYRIVDGSPRQLLTTVLPDGRRAYFDTDVSAPSRLVYGVVALNRSGRVVGLGGPEHIKLGADLGELRFACGPDIIGDQRGILCRWSQASQPNARGYVLYRSVAGDQREVIYRTGLDGRTAFFDTNVVPGAVHTYAVVAVNTNGDPIAIGGPQRVEWPAGR